MTDVDQTRIATAVRTAAHGEDEHQVSESLIHTLQGFGYTVNRKYDISNRVNERVQEVMNEQAQRISEELEGIDEAIEHHSASLRELEVRRKAKQWQKNALIVEANRKTFRE